VVAPEYHWGDSKGANVRGKYIVVLIIDPPVQDPHDPTKLDENTFEATSSEYLRNPRLSPQRTTFCRLLCAGI
jgi:hypothetical protein